MTVDTRALPAFLGTDAEFRTWGSGIAAQIVAVGLVKTTDTGQIDWTTVARPGTSTVAGYEIYRFNDSLQATKPVFIKLEYGIAAVADRPLLYWTVGTATNGAGTITGQVGTRVTTNIATASKTTGITLNSYCSGSSSRLSLITNYDPSASTFHMDMFVERTTTTAGVDAGNGIVTAGIRGTHYRLIPFSGSLPAAVGVWPALSFGGAISVDGLNVALSPSIIFQGKIFIASWLAYLTADIGELGEFACEHRGASHTFKAFGDGTLRSPLVQDNTSLASIAMLWE